VIKLAGHIYYIVDVFTKEKYTGNQLAVVVGGDLSKEEMQKIAREMHFSETTFITSMTEREGGYDVRIFTPEDELPFAGHPTLGTAFIIRNEISRDDNITLNLKVGQIPVAVSDDGALWMTQKPPAFGPVFDKGPAAAALGLSPVDIDDRYPVELVSTGVPFVIVPLKSLDAVRRITIDNKAYSDFCAKNGTNEFLVFSKETCDSANDLHVRVFTAYASVPEDPATGSGNGCLAGYLLKHGYFGDHVDHRVEQGYEIGRPSLLLIRAEYNEGKIEVRVGGNVVLVARGELV
jgi:trans-2,3-dihydro-3-hydroxyanthranilate isomerase